MLWTSHVVAPDDVVLRPTSSLSRPIYLKVNSVLHRQSVQTLRRHIIGTADGPRTVGIGNGGGDWNGTADTFHLRPPFLPLHTR